MNSSETRNILIFRIGQLGDTLVSMPAISSIRQRHLHHRLILLTEIQVAARGQVSAWDVLKPTGWFDDVLFYSPAENMLGKIKTAFLLAKNIRKIRPEIVYDLAPERNARQARRDRFFFKKFAGVHDYRGGGFLCKPPKDSQGLLPRIEPEWIRLSRIVSASADKKIFQFAIPLEEKQRVWKLLEHEGLAAHKRLIAIGPGSKMPAKMWAEERFRDLGLRLLADDPDVRLLIVGGKEDAVIGESLCAAWGARSHNLAGRLSIYGSAALLQHCVTYVGNDAGAMHLAGMVGIPCVGIFSARDYPGQWEPYGNGHDILRHETECAGCMRTICPYDNKCLSLISVDEVEQAVRSILTKNKR